MEYGAILTVHLLCATIFIGIVSFEVLILEGIRKYLPAQTMSLVEQGIHMRGRKVMPYVVVSLFFSGIYLASQRFTGVNSIFESSFTILLSIKILLALSVLTHFIVAMKYAICGNMSSRRFKYTHLSVFIHMLLIIFLAKGMFYLQLPIH